MAEQQGHMAPRDVLTMVQRAGWEVIRKGGNYYRVNPPNGGKPIYVGDPEDIPKVMRDLRAAGFPFGKGRHKPTKSVRTPEDDDLPIPTAMNFDRARFAAALRAEMAPPGKTPISASQLAEWIGIDRTTVFRWLAGTIQPSLPMLQRVQKRLGWEDAYGARSANTKGATPIPATPPPGDDLVDLVRRAQDMQGNLRRLTLREAELRELVAQRDVALSDATQEIAKRRADVKRLEEEVASLRAEPKRLKEEMAGLRAEVERLQEENLELAGLLDVASEEMANS